MPGILDTHYLQLKGFFYLLLWILDTFDYLDTPPIRVTGADVPFPYDKTLEQNSMPQVSNIVKSVNKVLNK